MPSQFFADLNSKFEKLLSMYKNSIEYNHIFHSWLLACQFDNRIFFDIPQTNHTTPILYWINLVDTPC